LKLLLAQEGAETSADEVVSTGFANELCWNKMTPHKWSIIQKIIQKKILTPPEGKNSASCAPGQEYVEYDDLAVCLLIPPDQLTHQGLFTPNHCCCWIG
jgi:hypothetical protein